MDADLTAAPSRSQTVPAKTHGPRSARADCSFRSLLSYAMLLHVVSVLSPGPLSGPVQCHTRSRLAQQGCWGQLRIPLAHSSSVATYQNIFGIVESIHISFF